MEEPATQRATVLRLGALERLARAHVVSDVDVRVHPEGEAPHQRPRLGAPKVPPERAVIAVAEHLCAQPAAGGDAEAVRSARSATLEEAVTHQKRSALRHACGVGDGGAVQINEPAQRGRRAATDWPEEVQTVAKVCTNIGERTRSFEGTCGGGACVAPVLSGSSEPARGG